MTHNRHYAVIRLLPALLIGLITIADQLDSPDGALLAAAPQDKSVETSSFQRDQHTAEWPIQPSLIRATMPPTLPRGFRFSLPLFAPGSRDWGDFCPGRDRPALRGVVLPAAAGNSRARGWEQTGRRPS